MARSQRTKLTFGDFGLPAGALQLAGDDARSVLMGTLIGRAEDITKRSSPDGQQQYEGLSGNFRIIPADPKRDELESGVLFIPDAFHTMLASALNEAKGKDANAALEFALEISAIRAKNPAGYSWEVQPLHEGGKNRLDDLAAALPKLKELALKDKKKPLQLEGSAAKK